MSVDNNSGRPLYIGGGFDILHPDHRMFITHGIELFKQKYGNLSELIIGLKTDATLNARKGTTRPFFSLEWRMEDMSDFLQKLNLKHRIILTSQFFSFIKGRSDVVAQVSSEYYNKCDAMRNSDVEINYVDPFNATNTSNIENTLLLARKKSNCNLRKVAALLLRSGKIISVGHSGSGNCDCCSKYIAYQKGRGVLSKTVKCDFPHAEEIALEEALPGDDLLITDSPCEDCADLIIQKGIRRVVYMQDYHNLTPPLKMIDAKIKVRKAGQ